MCVRSSAVSVKEIALHIARLLQKDLPNLELMPLNDIELEKRITEIENKNSCSRDADDPVIERQNII